MRGAVEPVPAWFLPWGLFMALIPFSGGIIEGAGLSLPYNLLGLCASLLVFLGVRRHVPVNGRMLAISVLVAVLAATFFVSLDPQASKETLVPIGIVWVIYLLVTSASLPERLVELGLRSWLWGGMGACLIALVDFLGGRTDMDGRLTLVLLGAEMDPNFFVAALLVPFALCVHFSGRSERRLEGLVGGGLILVAAALSQSRGGLMSVALVSLVVLAWQQRWRTLLVTLAVGLAAGALAVSSMARFNPAADPTGAGRTEIWEVAVQAGLERWPTGVGFSALPVITAPAPGLYWSRDAHDVYVQAFAEAGLPGLLALAAVFAAHLAPRRRTGLLVVTQAPLLGLLLAGIFLHLLTYKLLWAAWIMAAQAAGAQTEPSLAAPPLPRRITP